jgi:hypothetical protein
MLQQASHFNCLECDVTHALNKNLNKELDRYDILNSGHKSDAGVNF